MDFSLGFLDILPNSQFLYHSRTTKISQHWLANTWIFLAAALLDSLRVGASRLRCRIGTVRQMQLAGGFNSCGFFGKYWESHGKKNRTSSGYNPRIGGLLPTIQCGEKPSIYVEFSWGYTGWYKQRYDMGSSRNLDFIPDISPFLFPGFLGILFSDDSTYK